MRNLEQKTLLDWKPHGNIYLWMFNDCSKAYKNKWHLYFEQGGIASFIGLIKLLVAAEEGAKKTITLTNPANIGFSPINMQKWELESWDKLVITKSSKDDFCLEKQDRIALLALGGSGLSRFASELEKVSPQNERYIGNMCDTRKNKSGLIIWW